MYRDWTEEKKNQKDPSEKGAESGVKIGKFSKRGEAALISAAAKTMNEMKSAREDIHSMAQDMKTFTHTSEQWTNAVNSAVDEGQKRLRAEVISYASAAAKSAGVAAAEGFNEASTRWVNEWKTEFAVVRAVKWIWIGVVAFTLVVLGVTMYGYVQLKMKEAVYNEGIEDARNWRQFSAENPRTVAKWRSNRNSY